jgi:hypothetical protein
MTVEEFTAKHPNCTLQQVIDRQAFFRLVPEQLVHDSLVLRRRLFGYFQRTLGPRAEEIRQHLTIEEVAELIDAPEIDVQDDAVKPRSNKRVLSRTLGVLSNSVAGATPCSQDARTQLGACAHALHREIRPACRLDSLDVFERRCRSLYR